MNYAKTLERVRQKWAHLASTSLTIPEFLAALTDEEFIVWYTHIWNHALQSGITTDAGILYTWHLWGDVGVSRCRTILQRIPNGMIVGKILSELNNVLQQWDHAVETHDLATQDVLVHQLRAISTEWQKHWGVLLTPIHFALRFGTLS